jgi:hypothetical protein
MNDFSSALREGEKNKPARSAQPIRTKFRTNTCCAALAEFVFSSMNYGSTIDVCRQLDSEVETHNDSSNASRPYNLSIGREHLGVNTQSIGNGKSSDPPMSTFNSLVILLKSVVALLWLSSGLVVRFSRGSPSTTAVEITGDFGESTLRRPCQILARTLQEPCETLARELPMSFQQAIRPRVDCPASDFFLDGKDIGSVWKSRPG